MVLILGDGTKIDFIPAPMGGGRLVSQDLRQGDYVVETESANSTT